MGQHTPCFLNRAGHMHQQCSPDPASSALLLARCHVQRLLLLFSYQYHMLSVTLHRPPVIPVCYLRVCVCHPLLWLAFCLPLTPTLASSLIMHVALLKSTPPPPPPPLCRPQSASTLLFPIFPFNVPCCCSSCETLLLGSPVLPSSPIDTQLPNTVVLFLTSYLAKANGQCVWFAVCSLGVSAAAGGTLSRTPELENRR